MTTTSRSFVLTLSPHGDAPVKEWRRGVSSKTGRFHQRAHLFEVSAAAATPLCATAMTGTVRIKYVPVDLTATGLPWGSLCSFCQRIAGVP